MIDRHEQPLKVLIFAGSLRKESFNKKLAKLAAGIVDKNGGKVDFADVIEFDCPSYNNDIEATSGIAPGGAEMCRRIEANDAIIIASPEYNGSMPGFLKNIIDWVSRFRPQPFNEKHILLMSASPSMGGGNKSIWSLRVPLEHLGARVFPDMFSLAVAHQAFNADGTLSSDTLSKRFEDNIMAFMSLVEAARNYPCLKKAWIEFLGEKEMVS